MEHGEKKVALILSGIVHRSLRHVIDNLREMVLEPLEAQGTVDIYYHSWDVGCVFNPRSGETGIEVFPNDVAEFLPGANGLFDSQDAFDKTIDWERLFVGNPMRHCTRGEEAAQITLMNFRRAVESQQRAWNHFERSREKPYDLVIATRADLRFLQPLGKIESYDAGRGSIWVPDFDAWGGVNDRFAMGGMREMEIYCCRSGFANQWILNSDWNGNSESSLKEWLQLNLIPTRLFDFRFQRVRANGRTEPEDAHHTMPGGTVAEPIGVLPSARQIGKAGNKRTDHEGVGERFLILARRSGPSTRRLADIFSQLGTCEVIVDSSDSEGVFYPDQELADFSGLMGLSADFPPITAWSRAMYHLSRTLKAGEAVWFVEDDVAGGEELFSELVRLTASAEPQLAAIDVFSKVEDPGWYFWGLAWPWFERPWRAFGPLCRLGPELIREVLRFRQEQGKFVFHEILFASLAARRGMKTLDWFRVPEMKRLFGVFRFRPTVDHVQSGICHPVKEPSIHNQICGMAASFPDFPPPPDECVEYPRIKSALFAGWSILEDDYRFLVRFCRSQSIRKVVEFGPGDSTLAFLDSGCQVVAFEHDYEWLGRSNRRFAHEPGIMIEHCAENGVPEVRQLPFLADLVFVDGPPLREGQTMSRFFVCEWAIEHCGCFLLHDAGRTEEGATLKSMERRGRTVIRISTEKQLALVVDEARRPELIAAVELMEHP